MSSRRFKSYIKFVLHKSFGSFSNNLGTIERRERLFWYSLILIQGTYIPFSIKMLGCDFFSQVNIVIRNEKYGYINFYYVFILE